MLYPYKMDLHIHTALSPCADDEMSPPQIILAAKTKGLNIIAITDHNSAENVAAVIKAAEGSGIFVIPGMEVQTREEVHLVCLFPTLEKCLGWQETIYKALPKQENQPDFFGKQLVINKDGTIIRELSRLLLTSTSLSLEYVVKSVNKTGGLCIPAHVDRPSYSLLATLGFVPPDLPVRTMELSRQTLAEEAKHIFPSIDKYVLVNSSDAHCLKDIGASPTTILCSEKLNFQEIKEALCQTHPRKVLSNLKELSMHILDIVQNSIEAGATKIEIRITDDSIKDLFTILIKDNGNGMDQQLLSKVTDPFFTSRKTRRFGLGLPLLKAAAERCNGEMIIDSEPGKGTSVKTTFQKSHIDRAPLGNMIDTLVGIIATHPDLDLLFNHQVFTKDAGICEVVFDAAELRTQLEDIPLNNQAVIKWITNYLQESYHNNFPHT